MHNAINRTITGIILSFLLWSCLYVPAWVVSIVLGCIAIIMLLVEWPPLMKGYRWLLTPLYPVLPFVWAIQLNQDTLCRYLLLILIVVVAVHDTAAYCVGNLIGKDLLCPTISPKKTWQGFFGGFFGAFIVLIGIKLYTNNPSSYLAQFLIATAVSIIATAGDLFESWLKRKARIKDSGSLLPGHGGLLDRCDSMMACLYFVYPLRKLLLYFFIER